MPKLIKLYIQQVLIGFALSAVFTAILVYYDIGNLKRLVFGSNDGLLGLFLIFFFNGLVFAGVQFAIRIMRMGYEDDDDDDDDRGMPIHDRNLVPVRLDARGGEGRQARSNRGGVNFPRA
ncbi:MAG: hypothetical protein EA339_10715 [Rhodobacteraceae bacterium]|nr:MAG: hypothetical protein EA339_10715 [Paracoccaceae bacterium]